MSLTRTHDVEGDRHRRVVHLRRTRHPGLIDRVAKRRPLALHRARGNATPTLQVQMHREAAQRCVDGWRVLHERADQTERRDSGPLTHEKAKIRAPGPLRAYLQKSSPRDEGNPVVRVLERVEIEPDALQEGPGVGAHAAQQLGNTREWSDPHDPADGVPVCLRAHRHRAMNGLVGVRKCQADAGARWQDAGRSSR
jgi:hypothetical protein